MGLPGIGKERPEYMSGVFQMDLDRAEKEFLADKKAEAKENREPFVPSKALLLVQFGVAHLLYHQGTALNYWLDTMGPKEAALEMLGDDPLPDGLYVWAGTVHGQWSRTDCGDEYDEWLEASDVRPATAEEWRSFTADETVWDHDEMHAWLTWSFKRDMEDVG
jgi:hypothetical protein